MKYNKFFDAYYKGEKLRPDKAKSRYDITYSAGRYDVFEIRLINKKTFNVNGLSFNCGKRPDKWRGKKTDLAITKGKENITSVQRPNPISKIGIGNIKKTNDACLIIYNPDFLDVGIKTIEMFIAKGQKNQETGLLNLYYDGILDHEIKSLRKQAISRLQKL